MTSDTRDTVLAYMGYDHSDHSITLFTGRVSEFRSDIIFYL